MLADSFLQCHKVKTLLWEGCKVLSVTVNLLLASVGCSSVQVPSVYQAKQLPSNVYMAEKELFVCYYLFNVY